MRRDHRSSRRRRFARQPANHDRKKLLRPHEEPTHRTTKEHGHRASPEGCAGSMQELRYDFDPNFRDIADDQEALDDFQDSSQALMNAHFDIQQDAATAAAAKPLVIGDSWFGSVRCAVALAKAGKHAIMQVKTTHSRFPKEWIEHTMKGLPGGTQIVLFGSATIFSQHEKQRSRCWSPIAHRGHILLMSPKGQSEAHPRLSGCAQGTAGCTDSRHGAPRGVPSNAAKNN